MPLVEVNLLVGGIGLPRRVAGFVREGERRSRQVQGVPGFIRTDYERAYHALRAVIATGVPAQTRFLEWGSGLGVVAGLASLLGFDACGIEIEPALVDAARSLAADQDLPTRFHLGDFQSDKRPTEIRFEQFDIIYAYPWPEEAERTALRFEQVAADGALLLTYHSGVEFRLRRKVAQ